jgi:myo-inositol-1(or 4)-monophosphatase
MSAVSLTRPEELREVAALLAAEAADFVRRRRAELIGPEPSGRPTTRSKSSPTDPVTVADTDTERLIRRRLQQLRPGEPVLGEEGGGTSADAGTVLWVVDPIDGTVNFVYGLPVYAVSIAARVSGVSVAGAVADAVAGEVYCAAAGLGAQLRDRHGIRPLRCSDADDLSMALVGTGFGYDPVRRAAQAQLLARMLPLIRDVRRMGSAALDLCMVAAGRLDAHYEHGLSVWDWAAGALIAAEAGATVALPGPGQAPGLVVAAAPGVAGELLAALDRFGRATPVP